MVLSLLVVAPRALRMMVDVIKRKRAHRNIDNARNRTGAGDHLNTQNHKGGDSCGNNAGLKITLSVTMRIKQLEWDIPRNYEYESRDCQYHYSYLAWPSLVTTTALMHMLIKKTFST